MTPKLMSFVALKRTLYVLLEMSPLNISLTFTTEPNPGEFKPSAGIPMCTIGLAWMMYLRICQQSSKDHATHSTNGQATGPLYSRVTQASDSPLCETGHVGTPTGFYLKFEGRLE